MHGLQNIKKNKTYVFSQNIINLQLVVVIFWGLLLVLAYIYYTYTYLNIGKTF